MVGCIRTCFIAFALGSLLCILGCDSKDKTAIKAAWEGWDHATANLDGEAAAAHVIKSTFTDFERLLAVALDGKREDLYALSPTDLALILEVRKNAKRAQLKNFDGRAFYVYCNSQPWATGPADTMELKNIRINGYAATANVYDPENRPANPLSETRRERRERLKAEARFTVRFARENGEWRLDLRSLSDAYDRDIRDAANYFRMSVRDFILDDYESTHGVPPPDSAWSPMK